MLPVAQAMGARTADGADWQPPSTESLVAVLLVALATVVGACSARRASGRSALTLAAASGILLVIAVLHLLPDAWDEAPEVGMPQWAVPLTTLASFWLVGALARIGCPCALGRAGGMGAAAGLALHRFLEGATLAVTASVAVVAALLVHAAGEGLALAALLGTQPRRRMAPWIGLACVSPIAGALVTSAAPIPDALMPWLLAVVAGVLVQAAWVALGLAHKQRPANRRVLGAPATTAMTIAVVLTAAVLLVVAAHR